MVQLKLAVDEELYLLVVSGREIPEMTDDIRFGLDAGAQPRKQIERKLRPKNRNAVEQAEESRP
jgi:electron transfer flavoprotein alpha/beta subunit